MSSIFLKRKIDRCEAKRYVARVYPLYTPAVYLVYSESTEYTLDSTSIVFDFIDALFEFI